MLRAGEHTEMILEEAHVRACVTARDELADAVVGLTLVCVSRAACPRIVIDL